MNQACYEGQHLRRWTPIGVAASLLICFGIPALSALPIWIHRNGLSSAQAQLQYGWLYMKYD